jgi:hypothetical protein
MRLPKRGPERLAKAGEVRGVGFVVGEAGEMDPAEAGEMPQLVERADLVAAVGRIGDSVGEVEQLRPQPSPRAMGGPIRLASGSGSFFQSATCSRYLGSSGLTERWKPPALRTA